MDELIAQKKKTARKQRRWFILTNRLLYFCYGNVWADDELRGRSRSRDEWHFILCKASRQLHILQGRDVSLDFEERRKERRQHRQAVEKLEQEDSINLAQLFSKEYGGCGFAGPCSWCAGVRHDLSLPCQECGFNGPPISMEHSIMKGLPRFAGQQLDEEDMWRLFLRRSCLAD